MKVSSIPCSGCRSGALVARAEDRGGLAVAGQVRGDIAVLVFMIAGAPAVPDASFG
jgi:hypothetical protein